MKLQNLAKKSMLLAASLVMVLGVAAVPASADRGGDRDVRIRIDADTDMVGGLGLHGLHGLGTLGLGSLGLGSLGAHGVHGLSPLSSLGLGGLSGLGLGDRSIISNRQVTENFSSIPSEISITRVPGMAGGLLGL